jgi:transposase
MGKYQSERFNGKNGQCDLVRRKDGKWFLLVTVKITDIAPAPSTDFIGVDFGVVNLAVDSDGEMHQGDDVERTRQHYGRVKRSLQRKATRRKRGGNRPLNAKRRLKALSGRERRLKRRQTVIARGMPPFEYIRYCCIGIMTSENRV